MGHVLGLGVVKRNYRQTIVDSHRHFHGSCWWCDKPLNSVFWTVNRRGINVRVHPECRPDAALSSASPVTPRLPLPAGGAVL